MRAEYVEDYHIKPEGQWSGKETKDWLHPCHGPLPRKLGAIRCEGEEYMVALWTTEQSILTMTELVNRSHIQDNWDQMANKKGWIANTLMWKPNYSSDAFCCGDQFVLLSTEKISGRRILLPNAEEDLYKNVMIKSVEITVRTPIGGQVGKLDEFIPL
jgi:hypothetical protein